MEEKKRAMAEAEEKRRKKALEDRRQSQQQATERFRLAVNRIKVSKNSAASRRNNSMLDISTNFSTVKPVLVTTCIKRPPVFKGHLVMSQQQL